jgi:putative phosphoribosyl transferase
MDQLLEHAGTREVRIPVADTLLDGTLSWPAHPSGLVIFAHGSGSSRHSPRNHDVAARLHAAGLATLLFDLLTPREAEARAHVFDIGALAGRLVSATRWARLQHGFATLPLGYFGASTGAAAALRAAAHLGRTVSAVVSRGGRPDLAGEALPQVQAATLLIVGGDDEPTLSLNRAALQRLPGEKRLVVIQGATHLFEEVGALEDVAECAAQWFVLHLAFAAHGLRTSPVPQPR